MTNEPPAEQPEHTPTLKPLNEPPPLEPRGPDAASAEEHHDRFGELSALMHNRLILGGLGVVAVLMIVAIVLVVLGGGKDDNTASAVNPNTPESDKTVVPLDGGLPGRVAASASMRNGPDSTYAILGTIPKDATVSVVGRNDDSSWLQVVYPPGSQLRGWIVADLVEVDGDVETLPIGGAGVGPSVDVPTEEYVPPAEVPTDVIGEPPVAIETPTEEVVEPPTSTPRGPTATREKVATETPDLKTPVP